jgi:hypothetical protein
MTGDIAGKRPEMLAVAGQAHPRPFERRQRQRRLADRQET